MTHCLPTENNLNLSSHVLQGNCIVCEGRDDTKDYTRIRSALKILTFSDSQCQEIIKLLAAILHLGNVCFQGECMREYTVNMITQLYSNPDFNETTLKANTSTVPILQFKNTVLHYN